MFNLSLLSSVASVVLYLNPFFHKIFDISIIRVLSKVISPLPLERGSR
jgi:hypothetical protein